MKTKKDLELMKSVYCEPFGNQYDCLLATLEDYYIAKVDGLIRIKAELKDWDNEAQQLIVNELANILCKSVLLDFNRNEILSLAGGYDSGEVSQIICYIEEYKNSEGHLCARLRDKISDKIIVLEGKGADKSSLLRFLPLLKFNQKEMMEIYDRNGKDIVFVKGIIVEEDNKRIIVNVDVENGGYMIK